MVAALAEPWADALPLQREMTWGLREVARRLT